MAIGLWDYCVRVQEGQEGLSKMAASLGWSGLCVLSEKTGVPEAHEGNVHVMHGVLLFPKKAGDVARMAREEKSRCGIVAIVGTSDEVNRAACETPGVSMLLAGGATKVDVVMARMARENGVRIAFEFAPLLHAAPGERARVFTQMRMNARSVSKMDAPFVISSGALSAHGLRSPSELSSFGRLLGFSDPQIKTAMGPELAAEREKRATGKWVMHGVEVES